MPEEMGEDERGGWRTNNWQKIKTRSTSGGGYGGGGEQIEMRKDRLEGERIERRREDEIGQLSIFEI